MVKTKEQLKDVLKAAFDDQSFDEIGKYLNTMSFRLDKQPNGKYELKAFKDNRFDFVKNLLGVETQHCHQKLSVKKLRRLRKNIRGSNLVFIRVYEKSAENVEDFLYKRVVKIFRSFNGWNLGFEDGSSISRIKLNAAYKKCFQNFNDWAVYEDVTFFVREKSHVESIEEKYISRWVQRMKCLSNNKARKSMPPRALVDVDPGFILSRSQIYSELKKSVYISEKERGLLKKNLSIYEKDNLTIRKMYQCFDTEYQVLSNMEGRINEKSSSYRIRNLRDDMRMRTG
ncbi:hypothetical protein [Butyrivibrio sp. YAB3001]|uniref:hypothetical protein n=1 Tax=Butyrivibrio sp. YAB3001 TaxID=1520812 RepID=UPI0008F67CA2|nr:hypothetical protein SAMN02910398_01596 [Butyrivibrio sp. YAB3001]